MDVGSPENALNEINELLRNDGPCMSEELDLEFLMNKDVTNSYFYDGFVTDEHQEETSFLSDIQFGEIAGTAAENFHPSQTKCHDVDLGETNPIYNQEKFHFESQEDHHNEEAEGYIPNDFFNVQSQFENDLSSPMPQFVEEQDANLDEESPNILNSVCNEKTSPLQREMTRSESSHGEIEENILEQQKEIDESKSQLASRETNVSSFKKHGRSQSRSPEKCYDNGSADVDPLTGYAPSKILGCSSKSSQDCLKGQSYASGYDRLKGDSIGKSSLSKLATKCPIQCSEGHNPSSSRDSRKHAPCSSGSPRNRQSYRGHRITRRPRSATPVRQRVISSGYKRDSRCISRSRSPKRRDTYKKLQRYSPRRRTPPTPPSTKHHSSHRSTSFSSPPRRRDFGSGKQPGRCLFVAGFCFRTTERDLERKFSRLGRVRDIQVIRDKRSGDSRGFGFITMEREEDADAAIRTLHKTDWNGRVILVEKSNAPS